MKKSVTISVTALTKRNRHKRPISLDSKVKTIPLTSSFSRGLALVASAGSIILNSNKFFRRERPRARMAGAPLVGVRGTRLMMKVEPVTLTGRVVRLEPLQMKHAAELYEIAQDPTIWTYMPVPPIRELADMEQIVRVAEQKQEAGESLPFAIIDLARERVVGSTRYHSWTQHDHGLEIGWTWLTPEVQRTAINTECKYLLLRHAFETLGAIRVQLKTHHLNLKSQRAIERLGAVKEGVLRNHMIMPDGSYRHSVFYSIIDSEWPRIKANLEAKMKQPRATHRDRPYHIRDGSRTLRIW